MTSEFDGLLPLINSFGPPTYIFSQSYKNMLASQGDRYEMTESQLFAVDIIATVEYCLEHRQVQIRNLLQ